MPNLYVLQVFELLEPQHTVTVHFELKTAVFARLMVSMLDTLELSNEPPEYAQYTAGGRGRRPRPTSH